MVNLDSFFLFSNLKHDNQNNSNSLEKKLFKLRRTVNDLFFQKGIAKAQIARRKKVSRNFVIRWTRPLDQDFMQDKRGWPSGKRRKWDLKTEQRIKQLHQQLMSDPLEFYVGATAITQQWRQEYPQATPPPLRTIGRILVALGLSSARKHGRHKGAARYLCYPEHTIYERFGGRVLEADFIGQKYLTGRGEPLNFIGFSFKKPPRLRYFQRVEGQTAQAFIKASKEFFKCFELPAYMKVDNASATIGSASGQRTISQVVAFLLSHQVVPIFAVPRRPFSQASIEGNNSVFARKFWNRREFKDVADVDKQLGWFNQASLRYLEYSPLAIKSSWRSDFIPRVYFIRQVKGENKTAFIDVLNEKILVPKGYINYFVLAEWNLSTERLQILFEQNHELRLVKEIAFKINQRSYAKYQKLLAK